MNPVRTGSSKKQWGIVGDGCHQPPLKRVEPVETPVRGFDGLDRLALRYASSAAAGSSIASRPGWREVLNTYSPST
jgi:hypothetical protein